MQCNDQQGRVSQNRFLPLITMDNIWKFRVIFTHMPCVKTSKRRIWNKMATKHPAMFSFHSDHYKGAFRLTKKLQYLSQIHIFFDKISLTKIKTRKSFKKGSEKSQICQGKPTNTWQIKFLMDWSLNLSQIITPFPPSNLGQIFIWDVFFVRRNVP